MSQPLRFAPPTQLDALRRLMVVYHVDDRTFEAQFFKQFQALRQQALPLLGRRLARTTTPLGLRTLLLRACQTFPWPTWDLHLQRMLHQEEELSLFEAGCEALAGLCTHRALEGLQRLKALRRDPDRQGILGRVLEPFEPPHPLEVYVAAVREGEANPDWARQGAQGLVALAKAVDLPVLSALLDHPDPLTRRLARNILTFFPDPVANRVLVDQFQAVQGEIQASLGLAELLPKIKGTAREALSTQLLAWLAESLEPRAPEGLAALREAVAAKGPAPESVQACLHGPLEAFLFEALALHLEGKFVGFQTLLAQTQGGLAAFQAKGSEALDDLSMHLAAQVEAGQGSLDDILPLLEGAFHAGQGGEGLLISYLSLIPSEDKARLDRILEIADPNFRKRCIEALGAREEDRLVPFFLKAMNDEVREISLCAIHQMGRLPSGFDAMMGLFRSGQMDRMREAIHFFGENQTLAAAKPLMGFLAGENPDELVVDAAQALGRIRDPSTANALLNQLHSGKPLLLQLALAEALAGLCVPVASLGLLKKAQELLFPQVRILALQGALSAFPDFQQPFPLDQLPALEQLALVCCDEREGAGQWMTVSQTLEGLCVFDAGVYGRFAEVFSGFLTTMPLHTPRDREAHDRVAHAIRRLQRKAENLGRMGEREAELQGLLDQFEKGPGAERLDALHGLQEQLADPWLVLSVPFGQGLGTFIKNALSLSTDSQEVQNLCALVGLTRLEELVPPLRDFHAHASDPEFKAAARKALLALGLSDRDIDLRAPIKSLLLLEPNAFFRKRLGVSLEGHAWSVALAGDRLEAEALLAEGPVDLLLTESHDGAGDMGAWIKQSWENHRFRYALVSASHHNPEFLFEKPWVIGRLYKPYPLEEIVKAIEG